MKPSIGRIVHVLVDPEHNGGSDVAAAIITGVHSDQCVNLLVLRDGPPVPPDGQYHLERLISVGLYESREVLDAANPRIGSQPFGAFWPPRVDHQPGYRPERF